MCPDFRVISEEELRYIGCAVLQDVRQPYKTAGNVEDLRGA
jgi:hypothetical protein